MSRVRGVFFVLALGASASRLSAQTGREVAIPVHLRDGEEFTTPLGKLLKFGESLFTANWTIQEGGGRPLTKGTGLAIRIARAARDVVKLQVRKGGNVNDSVHLFETGRRQRALIGEVCAQRWYAVARAKIPRRIKRIRLAKILAL